MSFASALQSSMLPSQGAAADDSADAEANAAGSYRNLDDEEVARIVGTWNDSPSLDSLNTYVSSFENPYAAWRAMDGLRGNLNQATVMGEGAETPSVYLDPNHVVNGEGSEFAAPAAPEENVRWAFNEGRRARHESDSDGQQVFEYNTAVNDVTGASGYFLPIEQVRENLAELQKWDPNFRIENLRTVQHPAFGEVALTGDLPSEPDEGLMGDLGPILTIAGFALSAAGFPVASAVLSAANAVVNENPVALIGSVMGLSGATSGITNSIAQSLDVPNQVASAIVSGGMSAAGTLVQGGDAGDALTSGLIGAGSNYAGGSIGAATGSPVVGNIAGSFIRAGFSSALSGDNDSNYSAPTGTTIPQTSTSTGRNYDFGWLNQGARQ